MDKRRKAQIERKKERLKKYYVAETKILNGQAYNIGSRSLTRADLSKVQSTIKTLEKEIDSLECGSSRKTYGINLR